MEQQSDSATADLERIIESASRLGVELDEAEALSWLTAIAATTEGGDVLVDARAGVFGHRVSMLDFSDADLDYLRRIGHIVEIPSSVDVETALALSGSAAQSKIQAYPGDCDFFQRVNIIADSRAEACARFADVLRHKALVTAHDPTYRLMEVKFGSYPGDVLREGEMHLAGTSVAWSVEEIEARQILATSTDGVPVVLHWDELGADPGWCKLDWIVADPVRGELANASNMIDVTWESLDGEIEPLDGYLDPYFQEVYLDAESIPLFSKLAKHVSTDALGNYIEQLEAEVRKYVAKDPRNYGKAAKRMYNIFRLSGRYEEAAYLRELFDEPTAALYQVQALLRTLDEAGEPGSSITKELVLAQIDELTISVIAALEGAAETEIVRQLFVLRDGVQGEESLEERSAAVAAARAQLLNIVNNFFHEKLVGMPRIASYLDEVAGE